MRLEDLGEFGLIDRIEKLFLPGASDVLQGIGDDCAVLDQGDHCLLLTTDALVEGVHFRLEWTSPKALGRKSIAVNVSDIVAMGGIPQYALLSLGIPFTTSVHFLEEFLTGVREMSDLCGVTLVGGDTTSSPAGLLISVTLTGKAGKEDLLFRSGARPGDQLLVSGPLGESRAGMELLRRGVPTDDPALQCLLDWHRDPTPAFPLGTLIGKAHLASAMIDVSDGLSQDLGHVCTRSGVGAILVESLIPISPALGRAATLLKEDPASWALGGGEDYRLLVVVPAPNVELLQNQILQADSNPLLVIGEITQEPGLKIRSSDGEVRELPVSGYDHFSRGPDSFSKMPSE